VIEKSLAAALALASLVSTPAIAQSSSGDVRCFLLSNAFALRASNDEAKQVARTSAFFYLGRLDGRMTDTQLQAAIALQRSTLTAAKAGPEMQGCIVKLRASSENIQRLSAPVGKGK
jgi:hypothetical protein